MENLTHLFTFSMDTINFFLGVLGFALIWGGAWLKGRAAKQEKELEQNAKIKQAMEKISTHEQLLERIKERLHEGDVKCMEITTKLDAVIESLKDVEEDFKEVLHILANKNKR